MSDHHHHTTYMDISSSFDSIGIIYNLFFIFKFESFIPKNVFVRLHYEVFFSNLFIQSNSLYILLVFISSFNLSGVCYPPLSLGIINWILKMKKKIK
ncbi:uncharacterized protein Smp_201830 [Schistosoma mansoni]|uniref:uncharacterized protein n=1 Tax=Schistosoma mansoni TaxID=6183 RepID=UPI00022DC413|nr:uncharacterized protein Smp_201830 [Schistosoma mansoni]|eukprot:XP_018650620.1 uncharacterized protein Smp_201830 [Schistosoma mansoni]